MFEYVLIGAAILVLIGVPAIRAGSRRQQNQSARNDNAYPVSDSSASVWTFSDSSSSSDAGSCSAGDSSSGSDSSGSDCSGSSD